MPLNHHPDTATILAYAAGAVTEGISLVLAAHLESCDACQANLNNAEAMGGCLLDNLPQTAMNRSALARTMEAIDLAPVADAVKSPAEEAGDLPAVLHPFFPAGLAGVHWHTFMPGFRQLLLRGVDSGRGSVRLLHISPGAIVPQHTHLGSEITLVLQGSYSDETGHYRRGDLSDLDSTIHHRPFVDSDDPCICLIATDDRLHFDGTMNRMIQPLIGI